MSTAQIRFYGGVPTLVPDTGDRWAIEYGVTQFNATSFGASPNAAKTVNDAAILAAGAAANALGGGVVTIPEGTWDISVPEIHFVNYSNVTLRGAGMYRTTLRDPQGRAPNELVYPNFGGTASGENAFLTWTDATNCQVRDIGFQGAGTFVQSDLGRDAVGRKGVYWNSSAINCRNCSVERCYFTLIEGEMVYAAGLDAKPLRNLRCNFNHSYRCLSNIFNYGVGSFMGAIACSADDNLIEDPGGSPWQGGGSFWSFSRNKVWMPSGLYPTSDMILVANSDGAKIEDNIFADFSHAITGTSIIRAGFDAGDVGVNDLSVRRNLFKRCRTLNTNNAAIVRVGSDGAGSAGVLGFRVEDNDFIECGDSNNAAYPNSVGLKVAGARPINGTIGNNRFDNRAATNGLAVGVHMAAGVPAGNGVMVRPNSFASNIGTPYSFTVNPGGGGYEGEYVSLGTPESVIAAPLGSTCHDRTNGELYVKKTGSGTTGWKLVTHA